MKEVLDLSGKTWQIIQDKPTAQILLDPENLQYFTPFLSRQLTAGQAAKIIKVKLDTMIYHIKQLLEAGLLVQIEGTGRKQYRSSCERYVIPFDFSQYETLVQLMQTHFRKDESSFIKGIIDAIGNNSSGWSVRIHREDQSRSAIIIDAAPNDNIDWNISEMLQQDAPATWYTWQGLSLTHEMAKDLQHDMMRLYQKYDSLSINAGERRRKYVLQLALAPEQA